MSKKSKNMLEFEDDTANITQSTPTSQSSAAAPVFPGLPAHLEAILKAPSTSEQTPSSTGHTYKVGPSPLLAKLNAFLPEMRRANEDLEKVRVNSLNIS